MPQYEDKTEMGGSNVQFPATEWTKIQDVSLRKEMLDKLSGQYWKPLYFYLRRRGFSNEQAKELTQGFFAEVLLGRDLVQKADQSKGKLRTLLLTALDRYIASEYRSKKGLPVEKVAQDKLDGIPDHLPHDPIAAFDYTWAVTVLDKVVEELENQCNRDGLDVHWKIFWARVLEPILNNSTTPSFAEVCDKYDIENLTKASNMMITVKRRFQTLLKRHLRQTVDSEDEIGEAFNEFLHIFS